MSRKSDRDFRAECLAEKRRQFESNPCYEEQKKSMKCIELNAKEEDNCQREFDNFKMCKAFWYDIQKFRKINAIEPSLPSLEEREQIKATYMKTASLRSVKEEMKRQYNL